ncbi:hypothetical protein LshimejAT787_1501470 [Lyophyllum shimeji]|nr:hypothetical protein LshimejAT787_1501470 [Lyophyllum shimeji]
MTKVLELACGVCMVKEQHVPAHLQQESWYIIGRTFNPEEKDIATAIEKLKTEYEVATKEFEQALEKKAEAEAERNIRRITSPFGDVFDSFGVLWLSNDFQGNFSDSF